jgi:hypothetical protein
MTDKKISALTAATTPLAGSEVLPIVQGGSTVKVSVDNLTAGKPVSASQLTTTDGVTAAGNLLVGLTTPQSGVAGDPVGATIYGSAAPGAVVFTRDTLSYVMYINNKTSGGALVQFYNGGAQVGSITSNGTTTSYNITSDARLKENVANADDAASLIDALQVRKFDWKTDNSHQRYGFVAQELLEVAPEAVHQPADPDEMMSVDYSKLVPILVKEVQSLRARVAQLEAEA